ncbi:MAG: PEP-CTERM sorting domain-containing protein [Thiobacillus sp.]
MGLLSVITLKNFGVKRFLSFAGLWGALGVSSVQASVLSLPGIACLGGELTVTTGAAFSAHCTGDLQIDAFEVISAEESIRLSALGNATVWSRWSRLIAPDIEIITDDAMQLREGDVSLTNSNGIVGTGLIRSGGNLVLTAGSANPRFDLDIVARGISLSPTSPDVIVPSVTLASVPEPATLMLMGMGGLAALGLRRPRRMSHLAQVQRKTSF